MELVHYIALARRWLWILVFAGIIGGILGFVSKFNQPATYRAKTLIAIGGFNRSLNPEAQEVRIGFDLTETYAQLVRTPGVLEATLNAIETPLKPDELNELLQTLIVPETALLQLSLTYTDAILSAELVNELAAQLILASPSNLTPEQLAQADLLKEQITSLTQEITSLREQVSDLNVQLSNNNLANSRREELQLRRTTLVDQINQASGNIAQFTNNLASLQQATNSVEIVDEARIPVESVSKGIISTTVLGTVIAIVLVFVIGLVLEMINDTFLNAGEVTQVLKVPILGVVSRYGKKNAPYRDKLLVNNLDTRLYDEFRTLRTNLLFSGESGNGIFLITSASPSEGKSIVTSNLAITLALGGLRVLLIDADLRRPKIHKIFEVENSIGLTSLLTLVPSTSKQLAGDSQPENAGQTGPIKAHIERIKGSPQETHSPNKWRDLVQETEINNLKIMVAGHTVSNPTELLSSALMQRWMQIINQDTNFDVILIDTPPCLGFPDAAVVSVSLDARIISIIDASKTRRDSAVRMMQRFEQVKAKVVGIILNQANLREEGYYGYSSYKSYYESS